MILVLGSSCTTGTEGVGIGTSGVETSLVKEVECSSIDGTVVSSGGAGGGNPGRTGAGGTEVVTGGG